MDYRRYSRRAEWAVAAAVAMLHVWLLFFASSTVLSGFPLGELLRDAQWMSVISLVLAWAFLGPGWRWIRVVSVPVAAGLLWWARTLGRTPHELENLFAVAIVGASIVLLLGLVGLGLQVRKAAEIAADRPAQFSLRTMILATTLIAAAIGLLEALRPTISPAAILPSTRAPISSAGAPVGMQIRQLILAASVAITAIGSVWVVLQPGALWLRAVAASLLVVTASLYLAHLTEGTEGSFLSFSMPFVIAFSAIALLSGVTALPFRLMGYRLQTSRP